MVIKVIRLNGIIIKVMSVGSREWRIKIEFRGYLVLGWFGGEEELVREVRGEFILLMFWKKSEGVKCILGLYECFLGFLGMGVTFVVFIIFNS